jgi:Tol biopolymer transport system component
VIHGIDHFYWHSNVAVSATGVLAYLPAAHVREAELVWLADGAGSTPVASGRGSFTSVVLSPDGREAAAAIVENAKSQVWIVDVERGTKRLLDSEGDSPIWSRDGAFIAYVSRGYSGDTFYRARADGTGSRESLFTRRGGYATPSDWSPDGRTLLFDELTERGDFDVWIYFDGRVTRFLSSPFSEQSATFSADGRFVAYSADDGGAGTVYVQPFPGPGPRKAVSAEKSGSANWSADGSSLFFKSGQRIMVVPVQTHPVLRIGQPKVWLDPGRPFGAYAVQQGSRRILTLSNRTTESPLELRVILNWFEELNRLAPHPSHTGRRE